MASPAMFSSTMRGRFRPPAFMTVSVAPPPPYYLEDLAVGMRFDGGSVQVDSALIKEFAGRYDPQPFHLDEAAAAASLFWIATVPPTVRLTNEVFGTTDAPVVFGWIVAGHQLGAAFAALLAGVLRNSLGTYTLATMVAGGLALCTAFLVLRILRAPAEAT
jgi:acyl dehydratase